MSIVTLGTTSLPVSEIGLGLAAVGRPGYINLGRDRDLGSERGVEAMRGRTLELLDAAYAAGVRYVDAARSYGRAEEFLAAWLNARGLGRGQLSVGSKWGYRYTAEWQVGAEVNEVKDHSLPNLRRQFGESRALLGDRLCLYQIHSATLESGVLDDAGVVDELTRIRGTGLAVGLTVSGPRQADTVRKALTVRPDGRQLFAAVQATWNILEPSVGPALAEAHDAGLGVIVKEAVANGRLAEREGESAAGPPEVVRRVARRSGATCDAVAIAAALAQPWRSVVLSGAVTVDQLRSNLVAAELPLAPNDLVELVGAAEAPHRYCATRAGLAWS
jgi:aryl-alcohol dehydrogenase-like predicted oxidoreductase